MLLNNIYYAVLNLIFRPEIFFRMRLLTSMLLVSLAVGSTVVKSFGCSLPVIGLFELALAVVG